VTGAEVRALCLGLPETTEKETWATDEDPGHPTFRVRDKIYVIMATDESGGSIRTTPGEQAELMSAFPDAARFASHVGRFGWVDLDFAGIPDAVLHEVIEGAWARTAPRKVVETWRSAR
jgi:hypothetical protein